MVRTNKYVIPFVKSEQSKVTKLLSLRESADPFNVKRMWRDARLACAKDLHAWPMVSDTFMRVWGIVCLPVFDW